MAPLVLQELGRNSSMSKIISLNECQLPSPRDNICFALRNGRTAFQLGICFLLNRLQKENPSRKTIKNIRVDGNSNVWRNHRTSWSKIDCLPSNHVLNVKVCTSHVVQYPWSTGKSEHAKLRGHTTLPQLKCLHGKQDPCFPSEPN